MTANVSIEQRIGGYISQLDMVKKSTANTLRVCMPAIIEAIDVQEMTATVRPAIREVVRSQGKENQNIELPLLLDVPIIFPSTKDFCITLPISIGDECMVFFADSCIDSWWQSGGVQNQFELRRHDLSDAFCMPSQMSQKAKITQYSTTDLQIMSRKANGGVVRINATGTTVDGVNIKTLKTDLDTVKTTLNALKTAYNGHTHSGMITGVQSGTTEKPFTTGSPSSTIKTATKGSVKNEV